MEISIWSRDSIVFQFGPTPSWKSGEGKLLISQILIQSISESPCLLSHGESYFEPKEPVLPSEFRRSGSQIFSKMLFIPFTVPNLMPALTGMGPHANNMMCLKVRHFISFIPLSKSPNSQYSGTGICVRILIAFGGRPFFSVNVR